MRWILGLIAQIGINAVVLIVADYFIPGFTLTKSIYQLAVISLLFTALNVILYPVLKFLFYPLIILTLGLFHIVISAILLWGLSRFFPQDIIFDSTKTLLVAAFIISIINLFFSLKSRIIKK